MKVTAFTLDVTKLMVGTYYSDYSCNSFKIGKVQGGYGLLKCQRLLCLVRGMQCAKLLVDVPYLLE